MDDWIRDLFISGVSTRDVSWVMDSLLKVEVSPSEVSVIARALDNQVCAYHRRGLRMIIIDGGKGLKAALDTVYPYVRHQRCWVHKLRNLANKLPVRYRDECLKGARKIYLAANKREVIKCFKVWKRKWGKLVP